MGIQKPFRVALLCTPVDFGGAEQVVLSLLKNIDPQRIEIIPIVFVRSKLGENLFLEKANGLGIASKVVVLNKCRLKYLNPVLNTLETYRLLDGARVDMIYTHGYRADVIGLVVAKLKGLPIIASCHGFISTDVHLKLYVTLDCLVLKHFDKVIATSELIKTDLVNHGVEKVRVNVIQNAVAVQQHGTSLSAIRARIRQLLYMEETELLVGYIGRLSPEKGVSFLIEAASLLRGMGVHFRLLIIGDGPQKADLDRLVKDRGLEGRVVFAGFQSDVLSWLPALDVFVLPSLTEGTPMALLEAMAYGIPPVATAVGGVPHVLSSDHNGILVSSGNAEALTDAIARLCEDPSLRERLALNARETIRKQYSIHEWIRKIETEFMSVLNSRSR